MLGLFFILLLSVSRCVVQRTGVFTEIVSARGRHLKRVDGPPVKAQRKNNRKPEVLWGGGGVYVSSVCLFAGFLVVVVLSFDVSFSASELSSNYGGFYEARETKNHEADITLWTDVHYPHVGRRRPRNYLHPQRTEP
jgi:hypothetical protein